MKGYREGGRPIPPWTTLGGAYRRAEQHGSKDPFALPQSWLDHKARLNLDTPMDFVCTADIIGGNSGSPVVNREGELVGIIFDGNLPSLVWDYVFAEEDGRAIAVHGSAILEALRKILRRCAVGRRNDADVPTAMMVGRRWRREKKPAEVQVLTDHPCLHS